jgi:ATP synthase I chain
MLDRIAKINGWVILAAILISGFVWTEGNQEGLRATAGVALGGAIVLLNFWGLRHIISHAFSSEGNTKPLPAAAYLLKVAALFGMIAAAIIYLPVDVTWLSIGFSTLVVAMLLAGCVDLMQKNNREEEEV